MSWNQYTTFYIQHNKQYYNEVLLRSCYLNGNNLGPNHTDSNQLVRSLRNVELAKNNTYTNKMNLYFRVYMAFNSNTWKITLNPNKQTWDVC